MSKEIKTLLIDGYIDDPAALGVPPYISPMIRAVAGAAMDAGSDVIYISADMLRKGKPIPEADISVVLSGNNVPGKYLRSMPLSLKELNNLAPKLKGWKLLGGSAAHSDAADLFDFSIKQDLAASLYDGMIGKEVNERYRNLDEWNRWMILGADIVTQHQDFPYPLIAEVETYRGCHRYQNGGCSYCVEPLKGKPLMRSPADVLEESARLKELGIRNLRIGGQTCIMSYGTKDTSAVPRPEPSVISELFTGLKAMNFDVLHVDNANPGVIATYPAESEEILDTLVECCTPGNVLALGLESADPIVFDLNNLNCTSEQMMDAVRLINKIGAERGDNGLPKLLPGINILCGLDGETENTYNLNLSLLKKIVDEGLMVRRINIRQVLPVRKNFDVKVNNRKFKEFKNKIRTEIDQELLKQVIPRGTVLTDVYMELHNGNLTFGRQVGSYPILVGVPYKVDLDTTYDVAIIDWGYRSITGITVPFNINTMPMSSIEGLPGIGKKRAAKIVVNRPYDSLDALRKIIDDDSVFEDIENIVSLR